MEQSSDLPGRLAGHLSDAAVRYAEERHWDVVPGTWLRTDPAGVPRCSCGAPRCPAPGAHPTRPDWAARMSDDPHVVRHMWRKQPHASVLLPTGRTFDALEVSEGVGCLALARMERQGLLLGPVLTAPGRRLLFFVLSGAADEIPDLLRRLGSAPELLDLAVLSGGRWVVAPPTATVPAGSAQWVHRLTPANRWLPDAETVLGPLAYACARDTTV
ncbi:MAG: bifunctional DNA primase/polymerase [Streptomyces sp.]|nr:bifunctional DNA primase/polymerase [Streptomyces sp.]NUS11693.1 bifunctional DNA primase/polymerase [Streptomyces sp.]